MSLLHLSLLVMTLSLCVGLALLNPTMEEYLAFFTSVLERLNPAFVVERFAAEVPPRYLAGPGWGLIRNFQLLQMLEKRLEALDTWQGKLFLKE